MVKDKIFGEDVKKDITPPHSFIKTVVHSLTPSKYPGLVNRTWRQAFDYLLTLIFFMVFVLFLLSIFKLAHFQYGLDRDFDKFKSFKVKVDFELNEPIEYGKFFVMDNARNYSGEDILVTKDGITSRSLLCLLLSPSCIFEDKPVNRTSEELEDVLAHKDAIKAYAALFLVLLLPGLLLLFFAFYIAKFLFIIVAVSLLAFMITRISKFEISYKQLVLAAVYSSTTIILLELIVFYIQKYYIVPMVAYVVMLTVCIMLVGDRQRPYKKES